MSRSMMLRIAQSLTGLAIVGLVGFVPPGMAHGTMKHVLGTVSEIDADHVVVKTKDGKTESIRRDAETKYFRGDAPAKGDDLEVGDRVVIHAKPGAEPVARKVSFSTPKKR